ncbi:MAG: hypothetical protein RMY34_15900 [Aulosira sp. DedQUE10]|nr:hypothetical protein [Aulosira sp. DedQUE10]
MLSAIAMPSLLETLQRSLLPHRGTARALPNAQRSQNQYIQSSTVCFFHLLSPEERQDGS